MDQWTAKSVNLLTGSNLVLLNPQGFVTDENSADRYESFCVAIENIAGNWPSVPKPDPASIEQWMMSVGGRRPGTWRSYVQRFSATPFPTAPNLSYAKQLQAHLGAFSEKYLRPSRLGTWRGRQYSHILPTEERWLNLLPSVRDRVRTYLTAHPSIKLHEYFHHLTSSQAFAFNLFFPFFDAKGHGSALFSALYAPAPREGEWEFEHVPDTAEGTNVDVAWWPSAGGAVFCEVKLTEESFGTAKHDLRHIEKLERIYRPRLSGLVDPTLLEPTEFFANYQILRNIALLSQAADSVLVFLYPRANSRVDVELQAVLPKVAEPTRARIRVIYSEDVLSALIRGDAISAELRAHAWELKRKYNLN